MKETEADMPGGMKVLSFGIYSKRPEYPRHANLVAGLRAAGAQVFECHEPVAESFGERFRSARTMRGALSFGGRLLLSYGRLSKRFRRAPEVDAILLGHPAGFHAHLTRFLGRKTPVVLDAFFPLHDALVEDRALLNRNGGPARLLRWLEESAYRSADALLTDTGAHADYVAEQYRVPRDKVVPTWVGPTFLPPADPVPLRPSAEIFRVVFVGTYIPLHGVDWILEAARQLRDEPGVRFVLVGSGQLREKLDARRRDLGLTNVELRDWVDTGDLRDLYAAHDLGLGIFGTTRKAALVVPIKVFDMCAAGLPLVTADTPAARELLQHGENAWLVPPGDPAALARAILSLRAHPKRRVALARGAHRTAREVFSPQAIGRQVLQAIDQARTRRIRP